MDQQNKTAVWNPEYAGVWHLNVTAGQHSDSTANGNVSTAVDVQLQGTAAGQIDGADEFSSGSTDEVTVGDSNSLDVSRLTISLWMKLSVIPTEDHGILAKVHLTENQYGLILAYNNRLCFVRNDAGSGCTPLGTFQANTAYFVVATNKGFGASNAACYINGQLTQQISGSDISPSTGNLLIGDTMYWSNFDGIIDEVRISNVARSASWISTEYNNQSSPSTFMSFGVEETTDRGAQVSARSDTLSDSRPGQPSNHTFTFTVNHAIEASTTLVFSWPAGFSFTQSPAWYDASWAYGRKITLDSALIAGTEDLLNFPVLVSSTIVDWRHTDYGGHVNSATGWDFVSTASDGTTKLDHEIEAL